MSIEEPANRIFLTEKAKERFERIINTKKIKNPLLEKIEEGKFPLEIHGISLFHANELCKTNNLTYRTTGICCDDCHDKGHYRSRDFPRKRFPGPEHTFVFYRKNYVSGLVEKIKNFF